MAKTGNQKLKLLYILKFLREETDEDHGLTINQLIEKLSEVGIKAERKSLYDDFEMLKEFGFDIEKKGAGGNTTYHIFDREFELPELKIMVDSIQASGFITQRKCESLIKKIESLTSKYLAKDLQRQVRVDNRVKTSNQSSLHAIDGIHQAINNDKKVSFIYFDYDENKEKVYKHNKMTYIVSPWNLIMSEGKYYLVSFDNIENKTKTFRVDKIEKLSVVDEEREGLENFRNIDAAQYEARSFGMFGGELKNVQLRVNKKIIPIVIDRFGLDIPIIPHSEDKYDVRVYVNSSKIFLTWLMNFGSDIEIISPIEVKNDYINLAKEALSNYEN